MGYFIVNIKTGKAYSNGDWVRRCYKTERGAKIVCTKLNKEHSRAIWPAEYEPQWKVITVDEFYKVPVKMVERVNLMTGQKYMEAEDTPNFCSPSSESYWSM